MKLKFITLGSFLAIQLVSCRNSENADRANTEIKSTERPGKETDIPETGTSGIINSLQGEWKETRYPFRLAHFKNNTVKFTEEGIVEEPHFREYKISKNCPYDVNNLKNAGPGDIFLVMPERKTCEILRVANDSLILSGYNVSSKSDYNIIYKRR